MDADWQKTFRDRMDRFDERPLARPGDVAVSIKVRVVSGCFHREHSPHAYKVIDSELRRLPPDSGLVLEEHESGPELLVYLAVATAGITLAKSVVDLITTIIKARGEGVRKGDRPADPVELIVRRVDSRREFHEEMVLRVGHKDPVDEKAVEKQVEAALKRLLKTDRPDEGPREKRHRK